MRPSAISRYYYRSNVVDRHDQERQGVLKLEKSWVTHNGWFRLFTTLFEITVQEDAYPET